MKSLRVQLLLSHVLPVLILLPVLGLLLAYIIETQVVLSSLADELAREAATLAQAAERQEFIFLNQEQGETFVRVASEEFEHHVALFRADGQEWAIVVQQTAPVSEAPTSEELDALEDGTLRERAEFNLDPSQARVEALAPVFNAQQQLLGIVRVTDHIDRVYERLTQMRLLILGATLAAVLLAAGIGAFLANRTANRLNQVTGAIRQVAQGQTPVVAEAAMPTEFGTAFEAVNDLQSRLRESEATRKRLLANLVHELGRPLGALQAAIHALQQGADNDPALRRDLLQGMDAQVERLKPLLDNLASLHGTSTGAMTLQRAPTNLNEWLPKVIVTWREAAEQKKLNWNQEIPAFLPTINMDANKMAQVLGNLLSNAIKYTPEGSGTITVRAAARNDTLEISVQDTGIGISAEDQQHIFDPFYRGHNARFPQGMGLGLSIAREIVDAHGGRIEVESELGKGSVFRVFLSTR
jgi:signal transduction histidine kinase